MTDYQVMPPLSDEEYAALKAQIAEHGVLVPVEYDERGNILDGHHRVQACQELGITDWPRVTRDGMDEAGKRRHARVLNMSRRHLSREQRRQLIADEVGTDPDRSDREIGRLLGVDHKTVGSVRRELAGEIPHPKLSPDEKRELEDLTSRTRQAIHEDLDLPILADLMRGVPPVLVAGMLTAAWRQAERQIGDREVVDAIREHIYGPRLDAVLAWPDGYYADAVHSHPGELRDMFLAKFGQPEPAA